MFTNTKIALSFRTAILTLIGLFAIAAVAMNIGAQSRGIARNAAVDPVDCNIHDPFSPCFAGSLGYPAGDLFIEYF
jgi:hypothetical protein